MLAVRRRLAEKKLPREWDVLLVEQTTQTADALALELHRAVVGASGEYRAGPVLPDFEALWAELVSKTSQPELIWMNNRIDRFVRDEALALFLCAPRALCAVNRHVDFTAYCTTLEPPECRIGARHWSRR